MCDYDGFEHEVDCVTQDFDFQAASDSSDADQYDVVSCGDGADPVEKEANLNGETDLKIIKEEGDEEYLQDMFTPQKQKPYQGTRSNNRKLDLRGIGV